MKAEITACILRTNFDTFIAMNDKQPESKKIPLVFFATDKGKEPVRNWLLDMEPDDRREVGLDLMRVQFRWPTGMPLCRPLGDGLWEVRSSLPSGRIARVIFCFFEEQLVALHGFIKKSQKTQQADINLALKRKKEFLP